MLFYICVIPQNVLGFSNYFIPLCLSKIIYLYASCYVFWSSVVNPIICLSFVESYRRGLKNTLCCFCGIRDNKGAKRERTTLKGIQNLSGENAGQGTSKAPSNSQERFDNVHGRLSVRSKLKIQRIIPRKKSGEPKKVTVFRRISKFQVEHLSISMLKIFSTS